MLNRSYRTIPIYIVYAPCFSWPGEWIQAIFYSEEEAKEFVKESLNPYLYVRSNFIYVDESRDTSTE